MLRNNLINSKTFKVFLFGAKSTGKTCIIEQLIFGDRSNFNLSKKNSETIDDIYIAYVDNEKGGKEKICFYDTCGIEDSSLISESETIKNYIFYSDAIVLIYSVTDFSSFAILDVLKKTVDRIKEKKELTIVCLGNKVDNQDKKVDYSKALSWAKKEKIRLFEVTANDRKSLIEPFTYISSKLNQPQNKSTFTQLSRKVKGGNYSMEL